MRTITQELTRGKDHYMELASPKGAIIETGMPENIRSATDTSAVSVPNKIHRVKKLELELSYTKNPIIFNSINKIVQTIMSAEHTIKAEDPKVKAYFDNFIKSLGSSGSLITWEELLTQIFKYQCIYGDSWVENVYNKRGNRIVDWDTIDPKKMDYAKDSNGFVLFDEYGTEVGYTQTLPSNTTLPIAKLKNKPVMVTLPQSSFFIEPKKIAHIKLYTVGDGVYPIGLVEPIYKTSLRKMNMEDALANATYRHGFPTMWAKLGDMNHQPSPQQIQNMLKNLKDINFRSEVVTPYYYDIQIIESKKAEKLREHLEYYKEQEIAGLGIPRPYATGSGISENRSVLDNMSSLFELTLRDIINTTVASIRRYMFAPICKLEGFDEVPTIEWELIGIDEHTSKAERIVKYIDSGVLIASELTETVKRWESLD